MRAAASLGLVSYNSSNATYAGTPLLETLREGAHNSLRELALALTAPGHWLPWGNLTRAIREGQAQTQETLGADIFTYLGGHPDEGGLFSAAMTNLSSPVIREAVPLIDMQGVHTVVDVGGANGAFVLELLAANPTLHGILFDLPHVIPGAESEAKQRGLFDRISCVAGDFFDNLPAGDLYLLKFILHDWDDSACTEILNNCRRAMNPGGRIVVLDILLPGVGEPGVGTLMDMNMLALCPGQERDLAEFDRLFASAGLRRTNATLVQSPYHALEVVAS